MIDVLHASALYERLVHKEKLSEEEWNELMDYAKQRFGNKQPV